MLDALVYFLLLGSDTEMQLCFSLLMEITNFSYSGFLPLMCHIKKKWLSAWNRNMKPCKH